MTRGVKSAIDEPVLLVPYDVRWHGRFEAERERLLSLFSGSFIALEHVGSTAVPGLAAKPVIDMLGGVASMAVADALVGSLCGHSYLTSAEFNATLTDRRWLMRAQDGRRTHHLHLVVHGGREWGERLAFRDALRADAALARRYLELKHALSEQHRTDREAYTQAKSAFVRAALDERLRARR